MLIICLFIYNVWMMVYWFGWHDRLRTISTEQNAISALHQKLGN